MARITNFTVSSSFKIDFDHSFSSYETFQNLTVELEPNDNPEQVHAAAQQLVRQRAIHECYGFKAEHDIPRTNVTKYRK